MPHNQEDRISFSLPFTQDSSPKQSLVLQRRRFHHAFLSDTRMMTKSNSGAEELNKDCFIDDRDCFRLDKLTFSQDVKPAKLSRKYQMKDKHGNEIKMQKHKAKASISIARSPYFKWKVMKGLNKVTLSVRNLKVGTFNRIFSGPVTFSLEYIEFANKVQLDVSDVFQCEWCTAHGLPVLFLQTTAASCSRLRYQLYTLADIEAEFHRSTNSGENLITFILENEPTVLERITLQKILNEIGKLKNINNFLSKLTAEEASDKLVSVHQNPKMKDLKNVSTVTHSKMATASASNTDGDVLECTFRQTRPGEILVVYPPPPAKGGFSITEEDLACLDEGKFLNDVIIDFCLKYLFCEMLQKEDANRCHVFSSFFFKRLTHEELTDLPDTTSLSIKKRRHNRVKTWTRHVDLFEKDFIFVPINQSSHWYLAVICFPSQHFSVDQRIGMNESLEFTPSPTLPNPMSLFYRSTPTDRLFKWYSSKGDLDDGFCFVSDDDLNDEVEYEGTAKSVLGSIPSKQSCILIMDSLSCRFKPEVVQVLQEYLEMEWWVRKGSMQSAGAIKGWNLQVPQQDNYTDCGLFLLQYVESFIKNPPQFFHHAMDLSGWFPLKLVKKKRLRMKQLIYKLHHQQHAEVVD